MEIADIGGLSSNSAIPHSSLTDRRSHSSQTSHRLQDLVPSCLDFLEMPWVQSFIHALTLVPLDMRKPDLAANIATQLPKFHQVKVPASKIKFDDSKKCKKYEAVNFKVIHAELFELKDLTGLLNAPVVFAHNDLLSGNLMLNEDEDKLYFIDFEYGSYSYRGFDIGNHFNEYAGYDCDYSLYPNRDEQYHFFRHYLKPDKPQEVSGKDLEELYIETNCYMLASHMYWALWALIQAKMSPIDFDYLDYFFLRYEEFKRQKEKWLTLAWSYLSKYGSMELGKSLLQ